MESKVEQLDTVVRMNMAQQKQINDRMEKVLDTYEKRLRKVENSYNWLWDYAAISAVAIIAIVVAIIGLAK